MNDEIIPELCIMCHKPRVNYVSPGSGKTPGNKLASTSPFCDVCFTTTAPYYREHLAWTRRIALALEKLGKLYAGFELAASTSLDGEQLLTALIDRGVANRVENVDPEKNS